MGVCQNSGEATGAGQKLRVWCGWALGENMGYGWWAVGMLLALFKGCVVDGLKNWWGTKQNGWVG